MFERNGNVQLAVLEEKLSTITEVISKLDENLEQLSNLSVNISKMIAVHEEKLDVSRENSIETDQKLEDLSDKLSEKCSCLSKRISVLERRVWMAMGAFAIVAFCFQIGIIEGAALSQKSDIMEMYRTE